jgi:hypothetical protein
VGECNAVISSRITIACSDQQLAYSLAACRMLCVCYVYVYVYVTVSAERGLRAVFMSCLSVCVGRCRCAPCQLSWYGSAAVCPLGILTRCATLNGIVVACEHGQRSRRRRSAPPLLSGCRVFAWHATLIL